MIHLLFLFFFFKNNFYSIISSSNAQLSILAHSEAGSPVTISSGDVALTSKHLLAGSLQSNKEEYDLMGGSVSLLLDTESEMELETAAAFPLNEPSYVGNYMRFFFEL